MKKKTKILLVIWAIIVIILIALLTVLGFMLKNNKEEYLEIEEDLREAAQRYVLDNGHYPQDGNELRISSKDLYEAAYLERDDLENDGDTCEGYVVVYTENIVKYRAYIKCKNYMTENYQK